MKAFETTSTQVIGTFPATIAMQSSGAGATNGTPLHSDYYNNFWGWVQDLLNRAGLTPSGVLEAQANETGTLPLGTTATQIRTALQMAYGSPGELVLWCRSQPPATVGARILLLQGQTFAITSYKDLVAATYCGDGVNNTAGVPFYKSSDSGGVTRSTSGTYFTLPDARGATIRGIDIGNTRDPLGSTRGGGTPNGSIELDALQGHWHVPNSAVPTATWTGTGAPTGSSTNIVNGTGGSVVGNALFDGGITYEGKVNTAPRLAVETRMINMATYLGIRY